MTREPVARAASGLSRRQPYPQSTVATITVNFPTDAEEELLRRFTVNRNYLEAVAGFVRTTYGRREKLYEGLRTTVEGHAGLPAHPARNR